jgi:hypothetical protein
MKEEDSLFLKLAEGTKARAGSSVEAPTQHLRNLRIELNDIQEGLPFETLFFLVL